MKLIITKITFLLLYCSCLCFGQYTPDTRIEYTVNDGLPSSTCYDLKQDRQGYIWIATEGGLTKFDGNTFHNYNTQDGLLDNEVIEIAIDSKDRIWMNTNNVLSYMLNDSVYIMNSPTNHMLSWNFDILESGDELWIARMNELLVYNIDDLAPIPIDNAMPATEKGGKVWLPGVNENSVWVVDNNHILYEFRDRKTHSKFDLRPFVPETGHYNLSFKVVYPYIYYSGKTGVHRMHLETKKDEFFCTIVGKLRQIEFRSGMLYVLTDEYLNVFSLLDEKNIVSVDTLMQNENCSNIIFDRDNNLWGAIYRNGLYFYPPAKNNLELIDLSAYGSNNLESVMYDEGIIVAGSAQGELYFIENGKVETHKLNVPKFTLVNRILDIVALGDKKYLVAFDVGLYIFENNKFEKVLETIPKNIFQNKEKLIISTYRDTREITKNYILNDKTRFDNNSYLNSKESIIDMGRVYSAIEDNNGNYWMGNSLEGLKKITEKDTVHFRNISNKFKSSISRIIEMDNGIIIVATKGEGVLFIKGNEVKQLTIENGLASNFCYDVSTKDNQIFLSTNRGAHIISLLDFDKFNFSIDVLSTNAGLKTNEVIQIEYGDGNLFIATNEGLAILNLAKENRNDYQNEMHISEVNVNGTSLSIEESYCLKPNQNSILFKYNSPQYGKDQGLIYTYKMEGNDTDWTSTTSNEAHYRNLDAGIYDFKYKLATSSQTADQSIEKHIKLEIKPHFVETNLFKVLALVITTLLILFPLSIYFNRRKQRELSTLVEEKTIEVQEKVKILEETNIQLKASNEELEQFAYIASHDLQEPINTISGFSDVLKKKFEMENDTKVVEFLEIINNSSSRMKNLVQDLLNFSRLGREKEQVILDLNDVINNVTKDMQEKIEANDVKLIVGELPKIKVFKFEIYSLFLNLISNAIKYQGVNSAPVIRISCKSVDENKYEFSVKDNGIGISEENQKKIFNIFQRLHNKDQYQGTGIGLALCKKIVKLHGGEIWVDSKENEGSNFMFTLEN